MVCSYLRIAGNTLNIIDAISVVMQRLPEKGPIASRTKDESARLSG